MKSTDHSELLAMIANSNLPSDVKVGLLKILDPAAIVPESTPANTREPSSSSAGVATRSWWMSKPKPSA